MACCIIGKYIFLTSNLFILGLLQKIILAVYSLIWHTMHNDAYSKILYVALSKNVFHSKWVDAEIRKLAMMCQAALTEVSTTDWCHLPC